MRCSPCMVVCWVQQRCCSLHDAKDQPRRTSATLPLTRQQQHLQLAVLRVHALVLALQLPRDGQLSRRRALRLHQLRLCVHVPVLGCRQLRLHAQAMHAKRHGREAHGGMDVRQRPADVEECGQGGGA